MKKVILALLVVMSAQMAFAADGGDDGRECTDAQLLSQIESSCGIRTRLAGSTQFYQGEVGNSYIVPILVNGSRENIKVSTGDSGAACTADNVKVFCR